MQTERNTQYAGKNGAGNGIFVVMLIMLLAAGCVVAQLVADKTENIGAIQNIQPEHQLGMADAPEVGELTLKQKLEAICVDGIYPTPLVDMAKNNRETVDFVYNYPEYYGKSFDIDLTTEALSGKVPLLMQWDKRWGYETYGDGLIATSGCGPVSLSMAAIYLTGDESLNPKYIAEFAAEQGYCIPGNGSSWTLISEGCAEFGLRAKELPLDENAMKTALDNGEPIIVVVGPGDFTSSGHYMVITKYDSYGFIINDPNSAERSGKKWSYDILSGQIRNLWAMSKV